MADTLLFAGQVAGLVAIIVLLSLLLFELLGAAIPAGIGAVVLTWSGSWAVNRVRGEPA